MNPDQEARRRVFAASREECVIALQNIGVQPGQWATEAGFQDQVFREYLYRRRRLVRETDGGWLNEVDEFPSGSEPEPELHSILLHVYPRIRGMSLVSIVYTIILICLLVHMIYSFGLI